MRLKSIIAVCAVTGSVLVGGCGEEDADNAINGAQDQLQREAEELTDGLPDQARDAREQAEEAADRARQQIDDLTNPDNQP